MMKKHIGIFVGDAIEKIISGEKLIESRFSLGRVLPYGEISKDDIIMLKQSGGDIVGQATVDNVLFYDNLNNKTMSVLKREYGNQILANGEYWSSKLKAKYGTLIFLKDARRFVSPIKFKKKDRRPWLIIEDKKMP